MSPLNLAALVVALIAVIGPAVRLSTPWCFGLLCLACMLASLDAAYREFTAWAWVLLAIAAVLGVVSLRATHHASRNGGRP